MKLRVQWDRVVWLLLLASVVAALALYGLATLVGFHFYGWGAPLLVLLATVELVRHQ